MNKETRRFIWGIVLLVVGVWTLVIDIRAINAGTFAGGPSWIFLVAEIVTAYSGVELIYKTID